MNTKSKTTPPGSAASGCSAPTAGLTYYLHHSRFGRATVKVLRVYDEWADCRVVSGTLRGMTDDWGPGERKTVRIEHGSWVSNDPSSPTGGDSAGERKTR